MTYIFHITYKGYSNIEILTEYVLQVTVVMMMIFKTDDELSNVIDKFNSMSHFILSSKYSYCNTLNSIVKYWYIYN